MIFSRRNVSDRFSQPPDDAFLPLFYPSNEPIQPDALRKHSLHELAVFFAILANGCSSDLSLPQVNTEGESYFHLSRACLSFHSILEHASLSAVQATFILELYIKGVSNEVSRSDGAWNWLNFGFQMATSVSYVSDEIEYHLDDSLPQQIGLRASSFYCLHDFKSSNA